MSQHIRIEGVESQRQERQNAVFPGQILRPAEDQRAEQHADEHGGNSRRKDQRVNGAVGDDAVLREGDQIAFLPTGEGARVGQRRVGEQERRRLEHLEQRRMLLHQPEIAGCQTGVAAGNVQRLIQRDGSLAGGEGCLSQEKPEQ